MVKPWQDIAQIANMALRFLQEKKLDEEFFEWIRETKQEKELAEICFRDLEEYK